ncbi:putative disease resistance protein RGA3 [Gastrolobium bilobum]|uniref:putative disease resistance protein RGA3 n=1 Tax=Gastrolobium bilobum TaxID=150636 RepID=UPI002AAFEAB5|nr:putative disease resistance protein RGA3 [Gastrolobium bilobum]
MADSFVFGIAESLLKKLASHVYEEASRAYGVYDDLKGFKDTLLIVKGVLLDAEERKAQKHGLREWLRQLHHVCSDAEDVLDGFECQTLRKQVVKASGSTKMKVCHFFSKSNPLVFRIRMARQIKQLRDRLDKVAADGNKFGLVHARIDVDHRLVVQRREMTYSHVDASNVIGRENERENIIQLLMQPHPNGDGDGDKSLCVIPIVGIGGLGKTTLAKLVFNDKRIDELFPLKMWVCVSNDFDIRQIIVKIINSASAYAPTALAHQENISNLDIEQLQGRLRQKLFGQKFLLVLDDIWNEDRAKWIELESLIKVGAIGSKVMVTTRNNSIASMMGNVRPCILDGLSPENSLSLFVKWSFKEGQEKEHPDLVEIGKEIVKKCRGIPLAIRTLASSLFSKFDLDQWEFIRDHEIWKLEQKRDDILPALKLSYDQMPSHLRHCFAFFSLFPKDFGFLSFIICNLWEAHGLLESLDESQKPENIARQYTNEFYSRSFLQDFEDYGHYYCFKEFLVVDSHTRSIPEQVRHLSIVQNDSLSQALFSKSRRVRTIQFPIEGVNLDSETLLDTWVSRYSRYLRYLDLRDSSFETLPNSIDKLEHLRVLILSNNCKIKRLAHSICKLQNLQVLSLTGCMELETLPKGLGNLISLRRLFITTKQSVLSQNEIASLSNLQTLSFQNCDNLEFSFNGTQLTSLEEYQVRSCGRLGSFPLYILPKLEALFVEDSPMMSVNYECPIQRLRMKFLFLRNFLGKQTLPPWIQGAADTLQTLVISNFPNLKMLPEWLTTMTHLKFLLIRNCPELLDLPSDMHHLTALEYLGIEGCPELCRKCQPQNGEYWPMIAHIKGVHIGVLHVKPSLGMLTVSHPLLLAHLPFLV